MIIKKFNNWLLENNNYVKKIPLVIYNDIFDTINNNILDKEKIILFGSIIKNIHTVNNTDVIGIGDIDICYNLDDYTNTKDITKNNKMDCQTLLKLAKKHYGYLDNFILLKNNLLVRDEYANSYTYAHNSKQISKEIVKGTKYSQFKIFDL